jgi:serine/threonine protein kinase
VIQIPGVAIREKFAEGGASHIYVGTYLKRGASCAVKVLKEALKQDSSQIKAFKNEAKLLLSVRHPCIIEVWEAGSTSTDYYYIMEFFQSKNLKNLILNKAPVIHDWVPIAIRVADAILYLHLNSMVHRDVKPENILVNEKGEVKLIDLSIAMKRTFLTNIFGKPPGVAAGTPSYMSPEQITGRACDQRSDIYSLGATFFEMLTGRTPFLGRSANEILDMHLKAKPEAPSTLNRELTKDVDEMILKMLEKDPDDRVEDMNLVLYELKKIQRKIPVRMPIRPAAPPAPPATPPPLRPARVPASDHGPEAGRRSTRILVQDGFVQYKLCQESDPPRAPAGYKQPLTNLSRHGLGFVCDADLPGEHCLDLSLHLRGSRRPIYVRGKVAWCQRVKDASLRSIGVRLTARSKEYLIAYDILKSATKTGTEEL